MQGRPACLVLCIQIGTLLQKIFCHIHVVIRNTVVQWLLAEPIVAL